MVLVYVPSVDWQEFFGTAFWRWKWGMASYLAGKWYWFWEVTTMIKTNHWATVCMRASYQLWEFLEAVLLVSKLRSYSSLEADEVKGFSFARRVIWMQLSDRVAHGRIHQSLVHAVLNPTFSGSLFRSFWNSVHLEGLQAQCTGTFWTFTLCKLCALTAAKCYVQKISLQYWLWTSKGGMEISISCERHPQYNV